MKLLHTMEPLFPKKGHAELSELACEILRQSGKLLGQIPSPVTRAGIASLLREMNSYYSNRIEGHPTLPADIERALEEKYSKDPVQRDNQHLARAHVETEACLLERMRADPGINPHDPAFIAWLHAEFYTRMPEHLRFGARLAGQPYPITPGAWRTYEVTVGGHQPPPAAALPALLARFRAFYSSTEILPADRLIAAAAAHHRLSWIHPFGDGNGRVIRLYSHACLIHCRVDGAGLWTLSRGLARSRPEYYQRLGNADQQRHSDLDGRGNLSDAGLAEWCLFFLKTVLDQITFMSGLLALPTLSARMALNLRYELPHLKVRDRERLTRLLEATLFEGEIERGAAAGILGLSASAARSLVGLALAEKLLTSPTERGKLSLEFTARILPTYFPHLFEEAPG